MKLVDLQFSYDPETFEYSGIVAFRYGENGRVMTQTILDSDARKILDHIKWEASNMWNVVIPYNEGLAMPAAPAPAADALPSPVTPGSADENVF